MFRFNLLRITIEKILGWNVGVIMYRRPICGIAIAFILGVIIQYYLRLPLRMLWVNMSIALVLVMLFMYYKKNRQVMISLLVSVVLFGALNLEYRYINENPIKIFVNKRVEVIGDCIQKDIMDKSVYILNVNRIRYRGKSFDVKDRILLRIFRYEGKSLNNKKIVVRGSLELPSPSRNPRMFNYNLYLRTQGIHTILNTRYNNIEVMDTGDIPLYLKLRHGIKSYIYNETFENFPGIEGKVALSIAFGDKKILDKDLYEFFKESGTAHALAVSGLHFGILFMFINFILNRLKLREKYKAFISLFIIWSFAILVGFTPSVIRASSMITLFAISNIMNRRYDLFASLGFICLLSVLINPFIIFNVGFQLSFLAVTSIGLFYKPIYEKLDLLPDFLRKIVATTLSAQIGTSLIIAYHFNIFSPIALILNIPVVLLVSIILPVSLIFFIILPISANVAQFIALFDRGLIKLLIWINSLSSYLPYSSFKVVSPSLLMIITFYISLILVFYKKRIAYINKFKARNILIALLIGIITTNLFNHVYPKKLKITFVDVGQGDCILIETPRGRTLLVDGGRDRNDFLSEFLFKNGISHIDLICISHIHNDHIGGIGDVVKNIGANSIAIGTREYSSEEWQEIVEEAFLQDIPIIELSKGKSILLESNLTVTSIHPSSRLRSNSEEDINNNSLVLLLQYKDFELLLTGDIEKEAEREILMTSSRRDVDVIKVPHHGSKTSTSGDILDFFEPEIAVIQVGKNTFGHPHRETLDKLSERNIKTYRNDEKGAVIIKTDGKSIEVKTMIN